MADVVNLRQAKKARKRVEKRAAGDENSARFGRSRVEKDQQRATAEKACTHLDAHKREPE